MNEEKRTREWTWTVDNDFHKYSTQISQKQNKFEEIKIFFTHQTR